MPRILLADDHSKVRRHVRDALESQAGWEVCAEASTGREAVMLTAEYKPDIAVLDLSMPELNGLEAAREIHARFPDTAVLIVTMHDAHGLIREVLASGARACITKCNLQHLVDAVRNVIYGSSHVANREPTNPDRTIPGADNEPNSRDASLTAEEREIMRMLAEAKSNTDIALTLSITVKAVETSRIAIMRKLQIDSFLDLVNYAAGAKAGDFKSPAVKN